MGIKGILLDMFDIEKWHAPVPVLAIMGPLLGLMYIVAIPFVSIAILILTISYRTAQSLTMVWHRSARATIDT